MKRNQLTIILFCILTLSNLAVHSSTLASASWVTTSVSTASPVPELQTIITQAEQNIGAPAADAIALITQGAAAPQPYLTYSWLNDFAVALTTGHLPYAGMDSLNLPDMFDKSSWQYNYLVNHFAPALQEMSTSLTGSTDSLIGTLNNVVITTINNNTQMNFDIYQGANSANVGASNINLQPSFSEETNSNYPGFKIGSLKPGVNNVALYGAAQNQGDILFVPNENSNSLPSNGTSSGSFRIHFMAPTESSSSTYLCVQILPIDFPSSQQQNVQSMIQRTQCIDVSQANAALNITLQIEDNMTSWAPAVAATSTAPAIQATAPTKIDQSMIPMYYPSMSSMIAMPKEQNIPFLTLPKNIASNATLLSWVNFINIINGVLLNGQLWAPSFISTVMTRQPIIFLLKQEGNQFGNISQVFRPHFKDGSGINDIRTMYAFAGLAGTQYLFTGDIPDLDAYHLYLKLNTPTPTSNYQTTQSFSKSVTVSNLWDALQKIDPISFFNINKQDLTLSFVKMTQSGVFYSLQQPQAQKIALQFFANWPSSSLLFYFLSNSTATISLQSFIQNHILVSISVKDFVTYLQAVASKPTSSNKLLIKATDGLWNFVIQSSDIKIAPQSGNAYALKGKLVPQVLSLLQKNPEIVKSLLDQKAVQLSSNGQSAYFKSIDILKNLLIQEKIVLSQDGKLLEAPAPEANVLNIQKSLTQFWFSPTFSDGSFAELPLQATSPEIFEKLNQALNDYLAVKISIVKTAPKKAKERDFIFKVDDMAGNLIFSYTFSNIVNAKNNKKSIAKNAKINGLNITYQSATMPKSVVQSVPLEGFTLFSGNNFANIINSVSIKKPKAKKAA